LEKPNTKNPHCSDIDEEPDENDDKPNVLNDTLFPKEKDIETSSNCSTEEPEQSQESWKSKTGSRPSKKTISLTSYPRIPAGGYMIFQHQKVTVSQTCNLDCLLQTLLYLYKCDTESANYINQHDALQTNNITNLVKIFKETGNSSWAQVHYYSIHKILKLSPTATERNLDLYGSEERFLSTIAELIPISQLLDCPNRKCKLPTKNPLFPMRDVIINNPSNITDILHVDTKIITCPSCNCKEAERKYSWTDNGPTPFFIFPVAHGNAVPATESTLPSTFNVLGENYTLFAYTLNLGDHYIAVVQHNKKYYTYNDMVPDTLQIRNNRNSSHKSSCVFLIKKM